MKLTNWQVLNFMNIIGEHSSTKSTGTKVFDIAMTKAALNATADSIGKAREAISAKAPAPQTDEHTEEQEKQLAEANQEWADVLNTQVSIPNVPQLSIDALAYMKLTTLEAEFILHLPFITENVIATEGGDNDADQ